VYRWLWREQIEHLGGEYTSGSRTTSEYHRLQKRHKLDEGLKFMVMPSSPSLCKVATSDVAKQPRGRCNVLVVLVADPSNYRKSYRF